MWVSARTIIVDLTTVADRGGFMGRLTRTSVQGAMLGALSGSPCSKRGGSRSLVTRSPPPSVSSRAWSGCGKPCGPGVAFAFFPAGVVFAVRPNYTGRLVDRYGRARLLILGFAVAAAVSLNLPWLGAIVWVAVAYTASAVGRSLSLPAEDALVGDLSPDGFRGRVMGYKEAAAATGGALGPPAGGWLYETRSPS
jgi:MFS family permease